MIECDGKSISIDEINKILKSQIKETELELKNSSERQGILSKFTGFINNGIGIGTSEREAKAQIELQKQLINELESCKNPSEYAIKFKQVTGQDFNTSTITQLMAYSGFDKNQEAYEQDVDSEKIDIGKGANQLIDIVKKEHNGQRNILSQMRNTKAQEAIEDYKITQQEVKDGLVGIVSGIASNATLGICTAAGVCAAPFTGGASLGLIALGTGIAAGTGATVSTGLNMIDSIYDSDGDGSINFNYSKEQFLKNASIGALTGLTGPLANKAGSMISGKLTATAMQPVINSTFGETNKKIAAITAGKIAGLSAEGAIDGGLYSSGEYTIKTLTDDNAEFSVVDLTDSFKNGATMGALFNVGLRTVPSSFSAFKKYEKAQQEVDVTVNKFLKLKEYGYADNMDLSSSLAKTANINPALKDDIDKLYFAVTNKRNVQEEFIPQVKNQDEINALKPGDICVVGNSGKISIKLDNGNIEQLNISPETYMELFPPMERFSLQQQGVGDCYLVTGLHALNSTPEGRSMLLKQFSENADGSVGINIPNSKFKINSANFLNDMAWKQKTAKGAMGIKMLEHSYGESLRYNTLMSDIEQRQNLISAHSNTVEKINFLEYLRSNPNINMQEAYRKFQNLTEYRDLEPDIQQYKFSQFFMPTENGQGLNHKFLQQEIVENYDKMKEIQQTIDSLNATIDKISLDVTYETFLRNLGGRSEDVFSTFGLKSSNISLAKQPKEAMAKLKDKNNWNNHIFTLASYGQTDSMFLDSKRFIAERHAYFVQPFETESGEILFRVTNPWNTAASNILKENEILKYFSEIQFAQIK